MTTPSQQAAIDGIMKGLDRDILNSADHTNPAVSEVFDLVSKHTITPAEGVTRLSSLAAAANLGKQTYTPSINRHESNSSALIRMHTATAAVHYGVSSLAEAGQDADLIMNPTPLRAARDFLTSNGSTPSESPRSTIIKAVEMSMQIRRTSNVTTSDFTSIYENLANRMLTKAWNQSDEAYRLFVGNIEVVDFKPYSQISAPEIPALPKVSENSEIQRFKLGTDSNELGQLETHGGILGLSIHALVNGDINPFLVGIEEAIRAADRARGDAVFEVFTANSMTGTVMGDGYNLFDATNHSNWVASGAAPSVTTLAALRAMMQTQTGSSGSVLNLRARWLLVPVALQATAEVLVAALANQDANPLSRLSVLADARLDASSTTAYYLAAAPELHSGIDLATLAGADQRPSLEQRTRFATEGMEFRILDDFHVQPVDWRALAGNNGA